VPLTDQDKADADSSALVLTGFNPSAVTSDVTLPVQGTEYNSTITWISNNSAIVIDGSIGRVTRPAAGQPDECGS